MTVPRLCSPGCRHCEASERVYALAQVFEDQGDTATVDVLQHVAEEVGRKTYHGAHMVAALLDGEPMTAPEIPTKEAPMYPDGPPDYGTHPDAELERPRSPGFLVFVPMTTEDLLTSVGTPWIVPFGPEQRGAADEFAARVGGLVVAVPVLADHRPIPDQH